MLSGKRIPSSETKVHVAIYKAFPDAGAVIHTHSIYASALSAMHEDVPAIIEDIVQICGGKVNCAEYAMTGTQELADAAVNAKSIVRVSRTEINFFMWGPPYINLCNWTGNCKLFTFSQFLSQFL